MEYGRGNSLAKHDTSQERLLDLGPADISRQVCLALDHPIPTEFYIAAWSRPRS